MPKTTQKDIMERHQLTRDALNYAKANGVNIYNDSELAEWVAARRAKSDAKSGATGTRVGDDAPVATSLEDLERELIAAPTHQVAQMRKIQISGLREGLKFRQERQELISRPEAAERDLRIANANRAATIRLENELPPKGVGLDEAAMQKSFRPVIYANLEMTTDAQSEFWKDSPELQEMIRCAAGLLNGKKWSFDPYTGKKL